MARKNLYFLIIFFCVLISLPSFVIALEIPYPKVLPNVETPTEVLQRIESLPEGTEKESLKQQATLLYAKYFYSLFLVIGGFIAAGAIIYGGFRYFTSADNPVEREDAERQMGGGFLGLLLLLSSYLILVTINPQFTMFSLWLEGQPKVELEEPEPYQEKLEQYVEIPVGRLIERVLKSSRDARNIAAAIKAKAGQLSRATKELGELMRQCSCDIVPSKCSGVSCKPTDPFCDTDVDPCDVTVDGVNVRDRMDTLTKDRVIEPPPGTPYRQPEVREECTHPDVNKSLCCDYMISAYVNSAKCMPDGRVCYHLDVCLNPPWSLPGVVTGRGICHWVIDTLDDSACGVRLGGDAGVCAAFNSCDDNSPLYQVYATNCEGTYEIPVKVRPFNNHDCGGSGQGEVYSAQVTFNGPGDPVGPQKNVTFPGYRVVIPSIINRLTRELEVLRGQAITIRHELQKEVKRLELAEVLIRDSASLPLNFEGFIGIRAVKKMKMWPWDRVDIRFNPWKMKWESEDPATFYVMRKGNEDLLDLIKNSFHTEGGSRSGMPGSPPSGDPDQGPPETRCTSELPDPNTMLEGKEDYIEAATIASLATGVRASLILAIMWQESHFNRFPGASDEAFHGHYPGDMCACIDTSYTPDKCPQESKNENSSCVRIDSEHGNCSNFLDIYNEIKSWHKSKGGDEAEYFKSPESVPVSKAGIYESTTHCGGAMGPAQAMSFSWNSNKERVEEAVKTIDPLVEEGKRPVSPFEILDAAVFAGLHLAHSDATTRDCLAEEQAAYAYVGGGASNYAACAVALANKIASEIGEDVCTQTAPPSDQPQPGTIRATCTYDPNVIDDELDPEQKHYHEVDEEKTLIDNPEAVDVDAPNLKTSIEPNIINVYALDNPSDCDRQWPVNLIGVSTSSGQEIKVPGSGYELSNGYEVVILYADNNTLTIHYTEEDGIQWGYTIHFQNIDVKQEVIDAYRGSKNCQEGERNLAAYPEGYVLGTATGGELIVAVRDTGCWMDPRWFQHWWE